MRLGYFRYFRNIIGNVIVSKKLFYTMVEFSCFIVLIYISISTSTPNEDTKKVFFMRRITKIYMRKVDRSAYALMRALAQITRKAAKKSDIERVLKLLDTTFKAYRNGITKDLPHESVGNVVKRTLQVGTLLDFLHSSDHPVIMTPTSGATAHITHYELREFIKKSFNLATFKIGRGDRVGICLPEGPSLNLCLLATMAYCTCVPSNCQLTPDELINDYKYLKVKAVIVPYEKLSSGEGDNLINTFRQAGLQLIGLKTLSGSGIQFTLVSDPIDIKNNGSNHPHEITNNPSLNEANDVVMLFQTSGTTGHKKIVPYRLNTLCISTTCVIFSLNIKHTDTIINMMPLFHVGGIIRNLLTPVFSGGTIIQCQGFDPVLFCDILEKQSNPIWFYGVPSMQQSIIQEASMRKLSSKCCSLVKKICNAGGGLSPSLARSLKSIFTQAVILPSYGMTECMPICAPPVHYGLEREGTSGQVIGPDLAISVDGEITRDESIVGNILVRGGPCFDGYEDVDQSVTFDSNGWFDTGDMGYLKDGYIYITGRSKEVINRGGEIISPLEIENVLITHPKVSQVMVFSVPHETLQEAIGCVVVVRDNHTRPDLRSLRKFLDNKLHVSKHPQLLVYMNDIPKNNVGKVLRINFSNRLSLPTICSSKEMLVSHHLYEARCVGRASINDLITSRIVDWSVNDVIETVKKHPQVKFCSAHRNIDGNKFILFVVNKSSNDEDLVGNIKIYLHKHVHDYMQPTDIIIVKQDFFNLNGSIDKDKLEHLIKQQEKTTEDPVERMLCDIFGLAIGMPKDHEGNVSQFPVDGNFFNYGGNSLKSGFLTSLIRRRLGVRLPTSTLYEENCQTPMGLAKKCREKMSPDFTLLLTSSYGQFQHEDDDHRNQQFKSSNYKKRMEMRPESGAKNPFNFWTMLFQLSPLYLMYPLAFIVRWIFFVYMIVLLSSIIHFESNGFRCFILVLAIIITWLTSTIVFPIVGIIMKWLVIGRYKAGTYPLSGQYYLRWWFINKLLLVTNVGIFTINYKMYVLYLRLMGASIGKNCCISYDNNIQEFDLITIGSDCHVDNCTIRPFVLSRGHMNLKPIVVGDGCVLGLRSNIVAGTKLSNGTILGPQTTTYTRHMQTGGSSAHKDSVEGIELRNLCQTTFPSPHVILQCLVGWPLVLTVNILSRAPWLYCLYLLSRLLVTQKTSSGALNFSNIILYFADPRRIGLYLLSRFVRSTVAPFLYIIIVILVKRFIIGKFTAGPRKLDQLSLMRHWLMKTLLSMEKWKTGLSLVGSHYEVVNIIFRLLGAKVGRRVYWPGTSINLVEIDLLTVGNDVTFGSRSYILCGDAIEYASVIIEDGAMVADNCIVLPGARIGRNAILGSGGLLKKHFSLPDESIWCGSFGGNAEKISDAKANKPIRTIDHSNGYVTSPNVTTISIENGTSRPFGRAFYERKANYLVLPLPFIIFYNCIFSFAGTILWTLPTLSALQVTAAQIRSYQVNITAIDGGSPQSALIIILVLLGSFSLFFVLTNILALSLEIISTLAIMGRRKQGSYNWDTNSYCQRWQVLTMLKKVIRRDGNLITSLGGSAWIVLFFRALGCKIGKRVCLYPNGSDPVMTEPDLVVLEDDVAVDRASLVCHLNTLGEFSINPLHVGAGSVLHNDSRLASGATMLEDCTLLDRSYIVPGEIAEANSVWQGYPAISTSIGEQYSLYVKKN